MKIMNHDYSKCNKPDKAIFNGVCIKQSLLSNKCGIDLLKCESCIK